MKFYSLCPSSCVQYSRGLPSQRLISREAAEHGAEQSPTRRQARIYILACTLYSAERAAVLLVYRASAYAIPAGAGGDAISRHFTLPFGTSCNY